jgi:hypothetical protein
MTSTATNQFLPVEYGNHRGSYMQNTFRMMLVCGVLAVSVLSACGGEENPSEQELSQDFYGRWEGNVMMSANPGEHALALSIGVSINKKSGWVNDLCPSYSGSSLSGTGTGSTLNATGTVKCPPAPFGSCPKAVVTWATSTIELTSPTTSHLRATGTVTDCEGTTGFTAEGDLRRVSH